MSFVQPQEVIKQLGISAGQTVVDIGVGAGYYVFEIARLVGQEGSVYAVDIQKNIIESLQKEIYKKNILNIHTLWGDAETVGGTKLRSEVADIVLISNVLFQVESKSGLVHEVNRILKKKGRLVLVDWSESYAGLGPHSSHVVTEEISRSLFENNGFLFERRFEAGAHHYGLVFRKD